jgi:hypothetical protein
MVAMMTLAVKKTLDGLTIAGIEVQGKPLMPRQNSLYNKQVKLCCFDRVFVRPLLRPLPHQQIFRAATGRERGCDTILFIIPACFARGFERSITGPLSHCWKYIQLIADG